MSQNINENRNGYVKIHLSEDKMSAEVDLYPPGEGGAGFTTVSVEADLNAEGVIFGVDKKGLEASILRCLSNNTIIRGVPAARGRKAVKAVPSYWHLKKRLLALPEADLDSSNVDYRENSPYFLVKKGEALAKKVPEDPGSAGKNIIGEVLPAGVKDIRQFKPGESLIEKEGVLYAATHGRFEIREKVMSVNETLDIAGNVDYSTGHISFPGDVIIHGSVCDGFRIAAGKSIFVKQTMDVSQVLSHGDLVVEGGIKGRGEALVRVTGRVNAKFVENTSVESHGGIRIEKSAIQSNLYTQGIIDLGEAGVLVGGEAWALGGIRVGFIGRSGSPASKLRAGSDYIVERKFRGIQEHVDRLEVKLEKLKSKQSLNSKQQNMISQVEEVLEKMNQSSKELLEKRYPNQNAVITIFGKVNEGTEIHICELTTRVNSLQEAVTFFYDPDGPRISFRSITAADKNTPEQSNEKEKESG
ncbi:MAG: DUF342 domain-containing protein, partial [Spirochaetaceae bacterium]|nr:DUF342 domain-containing protein [Spirochaetaceae bacterium]